MVAYAASLPAEHTYAVRLVHHDGGIVLLLQLHYLRQLAEGSFHAEYPVHHDELYCIRRTALQHPFEVRHVVVLVPHLRGEAQPPSVHDAGMVAVVTYYVVVLAHQLWYHTAVHRESRRKAKGIVHAYEVCQFPLKLYVYVECAVQETAAGTATAILSHGGAACLDDALVSGKAGIGVGTEHEHMVSAHLNLRPLLAFYLAKVRIYTSVLYVFSQSIKWVLCQFFL